MFDFIIGGDYTRFPNYTQTASKVGFGFPGIQAFGPKPSRVIFSSVLGCFHRALLHFSGAFCFFWHVYRNLWLLNVAKKTKIPPKPAAILYKINPKLRLFRIQAAKTLGKEINKPNWKSQPLVNLKKYKLGLRLERREGGFKGEVPLRW